MGNLTNMTELYAFLESKKWHLLFKGFVCEAWRHMKTKDREALWKTSSPPPPLQVLICTPLLTFFNKALFLAGEIVSSSLSDFSADLRLAPDSLSRSDMGRPLSKGPRSSITLAFHCEGWEEKNQRGVWQEYKWLYEASSGSVNTYISKGLLHVSHHSSNLKTTTTTHFI